MATLSFNASTVAPQESFAPIPAGVYLAQITGSDVAATKSGSGTALKLTFEVLDGQYARRKLFGNINIKHVNPEAERIGQSQLSALCHALGVLQLTDSVQLHMKPVKIRVKIRPARDGYDASNDISGYEAAGAGSTPGAGFPPAAAGGAPAPAAATPPWARKAAA